MPRSAMIRAASSSGTSSAMETTSRDITFSTLSLARREVIS